MSTVTIATTRTRRPAAKGLVLPQTSNEGLTVAERFVVPNLTIKQILDVVPYVTSAGSRYATLLRTQALALIEIFDAAIFAVLLWVAHTYIPEINPTNVHLQHPSLYTSAHVLAWSIYGFAAGLVKMGWFVLGHECGHGAFSPNQTVNDIIGFIIHSSIGVPYFSWKISHKLHHSNTSHLTKDQPFVPYTREEWGLQPMNPEHENAAGSWVSLELQEAFQEVLEYSTSWSIVSLTGQLFIGWWAYLLADVKGQHRNHPTWANHFLPTSPIFTPQQSKQVLMSSVGVICWFIAIAYAVQTFGFVAVFRTYAVPYMWMTHWLVFITYLQHSDPALPKYEASAFTFARGALSTFDRELMGGPGIVGKISNYLCATATHGICETHIVHHSCSRIPHYHAWEAKTRVDELLRSHGIQPQGNPATWSEAMRILRECKFVESEGEVRFYKNAKGQAARVPVFSQ
ncbi:hypothetical protein FRB98_006287 [Tulasnella sp. 332]|nr:hypothetical protein FRB98_006287 [Tulasnella sp. 332]